MIKNDTYLFLYPLLKDYGIEFLEHFNRCHDQLHGIGVFDENKKMLGKFNLFLCFSLEKKKDDFLVLLKYVRNRKYYVTDYICKVEYKDDVHYVKYFMLILSLKTDKIPYWNSFVNGEYSKMYVTDFEQYFNGFKYKDYIEGIIRKTDKRKKEFIEELKKLLDIEDVEISSDKELKLPPKAKKEVFNSRSTLFLKEYFDELNNELYYGRKDDNEVQTE